MYFYFSGKKCRCCLCLQLSLQGAGGAWLNEQGGVADAPRASLGRCGSVDNTLGSKVLEASGLNGDGDEGSRGGVGGGELGWM